jgi:transcriptional regulator with XRE-family HTH domain
MSLNPDEFLRVIQMRLGQARQVEGLTQEEAADRAGLPVRTYQGLEGVRDRRSFNPKLLTLYAAAKAVNIALETLLKSPSKEEVEDLKKLLNSTGLKRKS